MYKALHLTRFPSTVRQWLLVWAAVFCLSEVTAQTNDTLTSPSRRGRKELLSQVDKVLTDRYYHTPYDTNYVVRPEGRLTLRVRLNQRGNTFHVKGTVGGVHSHADLSTMHKTTLSIGASYRGIAASLAINPAKLRGVYKDYELGFNYYSSRLSLDGSYQRSTTLAGDVYRGDNLQEIESGDFTLKIVNIAGYYIFNHRRFSYPAVFTQSYIQRRSAGSWLAGISYQGGTIETSDELKAKDSTTPDVQVELNHIGIGGGYGYNWMLGRRWLLHFSMLPTFVFYNHNKFIVNGESKVGNRMRFNMIFNERAAIVHYFPKRYFAGITLVMNNSLFGNDEVVVNQNKWLARAFVGLRL